ncbi:MAG: hypothetical protein M3437_03610 [Chloroflexota bacterium]|nr:hypothetical protein [Chloroflexota bacterium]MDQ5865926.1 hypothetical protein [Chloroflexota bacterium]
MRRARTRALKPDSSSTGRGLAWLLPPLFFLAWAIAFSFPLVLHLGDSVILSRGSDAWLHLWDLWWVDKALVDLQQNPYQTTYLYHPTGLNLYYHSLNLLNALVSIPFQHLFNLTAAFNLLVLANLTLDGLTAYWLCRERTGSAGAGLVGGALFASTPLLGTSLDFGQLDEVTVWWVPLYMLALWRALDSPGPVWKPGGGRRAAVCAGLCLVGASLATWYFTAGLAVFTAFFVPLYLLQKDGGGTRQYLTRLWNAGLKVAVAVALFVALLSPLLWAMISERLSGATYMLPAPRTTIFNSVDVLALFAPAQLELPELNAHNSTVALGYVAIVLGVLGLVARRNLALPLGVALLALIVMSLGPVLQVAGNETGVPMPYALLNNVPFIGASRQPLRFLATAGMILSLLGAYGFAWWMARLRNSGSRARVTGAALLLIAVELFGVPRQLATTQAGEAVDFLRSSAEAGAVLEVPYGEYSALSLLHQTVHERPIVGGYTSRHFPYPFADAAPGLAQLVRADPAPLVAEDVVAPTVPETAQQSLDYYSIRYVVVHKDDLATGRYGRLEEVLEALFGGESPAYEDEDVAIYMAAGRDVVAGEQLPLVGLGGGWHSVEPDPTHRWTGSNVVDGNALVWIGIAPAAEGTYRLQMTAYAYEKPRTVSIELDGKVLVQQALTPAFTELDIDLGHLHAGNHILLLKAHEPPDSPPGDERRLAIGTTRLAIVRQP